MPDGSFSVLLIQDYGDFFIKKYKTLTGIPPFIISPNIINNKLVFIIKNGYKLELQAPETMKLIGKTEKNNR